jgi:hypothetical protein
MVPAGSPHLPGWLGTGDTPHLPSKCPWQNFPQQPRKPGHQTAGGGHGPGVRTATPPAPICLFVYLFISSKLSRSSAPALHCSPRSPATRADPPGPARRLLAPRPGPFRLVWPGSRMRACANCRKPLNRIQPRHNLHSRQPLRVNRGG